MFHQKLVYDKSLSADEFYRVAIKQMKPMKFKSLKKKHKKGGTNSSVHSKSNTFRKPSMQTMGTIKSLGTNLERIPDDD